VPQDPESRKYLACVCAGCLIDIIPIQSCSINAPTFVIFLCQYLSYLCHSSFLVFSPPITSPSLSPSLPPSLPFSFLQSLPSSRPSPKPP